MNYKKEVGWKREPLVNIYICRKAHNRFKKQPKSIIMIISKTILKSFLLVFFLGLVEMACTSTPVITESQSIKENTQIQTKIQQRKIYVPPIKKIKIKKPLPGFLTKLPKEIVDLLRVKKISGKGMSAYIHEVKSSVPLLTFNADVPRNPASVMKLVTTYAALGVLGSNYHWPIELYKTGNIEKGVLQGNLYLKGYGYPNFKPNDLRRLLKGLRTRGIKKITGNLVLDNTYFAPNIKGSGDFDGKTYARYNALPDALLYNEGISELYLTPKSKSVSLISLYPDENITLVNNVKLKNVKCRGRYASPFMRVKPKAKKKAIYFTGSLSSRCGQRRYTIVISKAVNMVNGSFRKIWTMEMGGSIEGKKLIVAKIPNNAHLLYSIKGKAVKDILPLVNKKSNNVMARQLFLSIAAKAGTPATLKKGADKIRQWYLSRGLDFSKLQIENGSGLSRTGRISARHVGELLLDAYKSPNKNNLLKSLPIMGVDGTLRRRMRGTIAAKNSFMKTGTLRDARGIAGYVKAKNGKTYVVVILHNGSNAKSRVLAVHNKLIEWTIEQNL
jgi:D-alanyl-D-alanine carboxypeptidase/D-alanyl-D-alanine-endopeptidase (penicillin-binding protein 4)